MSQAVEKLFSFSINVMPAKASNILKRLDSRFHGNDSNRGESYKKQFFNSLVQSDPNNTHVWPQIYTDRHR